MSKQESDPGKGGPVAIAEQGNFTHASCACGWRGPARRSRKKARSDAASHLDEGCTAVGGAKG
ncbi:MAG TPA: hypothetical protein VF143_10640 [Candidatus Nanopelagicales bacterium]